MSFWSIKNIDLEVGELDRNLLESRKYVMTMKINAASREGQKMWKKCNHLYSGNEGKCEIELLNRWAEQGIFAVKMKKQAGTN